MRGADRRNYQVVWQDEFGGAAGTAPDTSKWTFDIGTGDNGWGNQELQYYSDRPENVSLYSNGNLVITDRTESFQGSPFTWPGLILKDCLSRPMVE